MTTPLLQCSFKIYIRIHRFSPAPAGDLTTQRDTLANDIAEANNTLVTAENVSEELNDTSFLDLVGGFGRRKVTPTSS